VVCVSDVHRGDDSRVFIVFLERGIALKARRDGEKIVRIRLREQELRRNMINRIGDRRVAVDAELRVQSESLVLRNHSAISER